MNGTGSAHIRWKRVHLLYTVGLTLVGIAGILTTTKDRIALVLSKEGLNQFPILHLSIVLLALVILLIIQWMSANHGEMEMLQHYFGDVVSLVPSEAYFIVAGIAFLLGIMGYFSNNIMVFSGMFASYNLLTVWGSWIVNERCKEMLAKAKSIGNLSDARQHDLEAIERYYLKRPHYPRLMTIIFVSFSSLVISLVARLHAGMPLETYFIIIAYVVMILNIVVSEIAVTIWRIKRDKALGERYR
jgi:hypothetical protein